MKATCHHWRAGDQRAVFSSKVPRTRVADRLERLLTVLFDCLYAAIEQVIEEKAREGVVVDDFLVEREVIVGQFRQFLLGHFDKRKPLFTREKRRSASFRFAIAHILPIIDRGFTTQSHYACKNASRIASYWCA